MIEELQPMAAVLAESDRQRRAALAGLSDEQLQVPLPGRDWSIRDSLAHLAANEALMTELAEGIATGKRVAAPADFDNERFNAESVAAARGRSTAQLLAAMAGTERELEDFLSRVTPGQLARHGTHPLQGDLTLPEFLTVIYNHRVEHTRDIIAQARRLRR